MALVVLDAFALACVYRMPRGEPMRGPGIVLAALALVAGSVRSAGAGGATAKRGTSFMQTAWWVFAAASYPRLNPWLEAAVALLVGAMSSAWAEPEERAMAGAATGGVIAVAWNAWRFGAPAERVFAVALCAAVGVAAARGRLASR